MTVTWLAEFATAAACAARAARALPGAVPPAHPPVEAGALMLYPGDAGYESGELEAAGARHRLWALADPWRYERTQAARRARAASRRRAKPIMIA